MCNEDRDIKKDFVINLQGLLCLLLCCKMIFKKFDHLCANENETVMKDHISLKLWGYLFVTSLSPAFLETHLLYLTYRLLKDQSIDVLSKLIASATGSVRCQLHVN